MAKELASTTDELKKQQASLQAYRRALAVLEDNPVEPDANLAAARYLCFVRGDWEHGVSMLALGSDLALREVALLELRKANSAEQQAAIGDGWWDAAETRKGSERDALRLRAGLWYQQAAPKLAGALAGLRIKQRLDEVEKLRAAGSAVAERTAPTKEQSSRQHLVFQFNERAFSEKYWEWSARVARTRQSAHVELDRHQARRQGDLNTWSSRLRGAESRGGVVVVEEGDAGPEVNLSDHSSVLRRLDFVFTCVGRAALEQKLPKAASRAQHAAREAGQQLRVLERKLQDQQQRRKRASDATEAMRLDSTLAGARTAYEQQKRLADFATLVLGRDCLQASCVPDGCELLKDEADELRKALPT